MACVVSRWLPASPVFIYHLFNAMKSLKNILKRGNNKHSRKQQNAFGPSPAASMASISTASSSQNPSTPPPGAIYETRGIFRTLEPVWYYNVSLTGSLQSNLQTEDEISNWIRFEDQCQYVLESSYNRHHQSCQLNHPSLGPCVIEFHPKPKPKVSTTVKQRPVTMMMMSPAPSKTELETEPLPPRPLILGQNVRRIVAPVWWYEQDSLDGSKGMCRFDYKNQARLEALSDDERTKFTLTDTAFPCPFTVVLDNGKSRDQKEEMRGFMHIEIIARDTYFYQSQISPILVNAMNDKTAAAADFMYSDDDPWLVGGEPLVRRFSI